MPEKPPKPLTEKELTRLEELERLADCGPWKALVDLRGVGDTYTPEDGIQFGGESDYGGFSTPGIGSGGFDGAATVRLIAAMRNALPGMLAEIRAGRRNGSRGEE